MEHLRLSALLVAVLAAAAVVDASVLPQEVPFLPSDPGNPSSMGNKFLIAYMRNILPRDGALPVPDAYFMVSTTDRETVEFDVNTRFGGVANTTTFTVTYNQPRRISFPADQVYITARGDREEKVIWVQAEMGKKISVYVINDEARSTDGFVALPCDAMVVPGDYRRYQYLILSTDQDVTDQQGSTQRSSQFLMVTCEDDTTVTVIPSSDISGGGDFPNPLFGPGLSPESSNWQINGNALIPAKQHLLITKNDDFTGTVIQSTKPLVVISGHQCGQVPEAVTACDHIASQVPPQTTWGYTFLLNPLDARFSGDFYRYGVATSTLQVTSTEVTISCVEAGGGNATVEHRSTITSTQRQNWGQFETHPGNCDPSDDFSPKFCCLQATNPVQVAQYSYGHSADVSCKQNGDLGDPFMSIIPPVIQYKRYYHLVPITVIAGPIAVRRVGVSVYVNYFQPNRIMLDDAPFEADRSRWQAIYCPSNPSEICGYAITKALDDSPHVLFHADEGAAIFVHSYGFLNENSYGLSGGMELQPIAGTTIRCTIADDCVMEDTTVNVVCTRFGDRTVQSRIIIGSEDGTAMAGADYDRVDFAGIGGNNLPRNTINYRGGMRQTVSESFPVTIRADSDDTEPPETFFITVSPVRTAVVLTPRVTVTICGVGGCPELPDITNGGVTWTGLNPGNTATYTCNSGFTLVGSETRTCGNDGTWSGDQPTCQPVMCPELPDITNGGVTWTGLNPGNTATYTCNSGFTLVGSETRTCGNDGTWSGDQPTCQPVMCPVLPDITNGGVTWTGLSAESIATYTCNSGFQLVGSPTRVCGGDGTWGGMQPVCISAEVMVEFDPVAYTVTEGVDANAVLMLVRSGGLSRTVVVTVTTAAGTAGAGGDFTSTTMLVTFGPNVLSASVSVPITDDLIIESSEMFSGILTTSEDNVVIGADTADVTILDDDVMVEFDPIAYTVTEGVDANAVLMLVRRGDLSRTVVISVTTAAGTAGASDFMTTSMMVTFISGQSSASVNVPIINDDVIEVPETFTASLSAVTGNVVIGADTADVTILDPDVLVSFNPIAYTVTEGVDANAVLMLVRSGGLSRSVVVTVTTASGTANAGDDFTSTTMLVTFGPNVLSASVSVPITDDLIIEDTEMFSGILTTSEDNVVIGADTADVTILNDDVMVEFDPTTYTVREGDANAVLMLIRSGDLSRTTVVTVETISGTADGSTDYTTTSMMVTFNPGEGSASVNVPIINDDVAEDSEMFTASLSAVTGNVVIGDDTADIVIIDNDMAQPAFEQTVYTVPENDRSSVELCINVGVILPAATDYTITALQKTPPDADDEDFNSMTTITVVPPSDRACINFTSLVVDDTIALEGDQCFKIMVGDSMANVTILDDDVPIIVSEDVIINEDEGIAIVNVSLENEIEKEFTLDYNTTEVPDGADEDADFDGQTGSITFVPGGEKVQSIDIPITDDQTTEPDEPLMISFSSSDLPPDTQIEVPTPKVTIIDNDIVVGFDPTEYAVTEGTDAFVTLTIFRRGNIDLPANVTFMTAPGTAEEILDFTPTMGNLEFLPGEESKQVTVPITNDGIQEDDEIFFGLLVSDQPNVIVVANASNATITIFDEDRVTIGFVDTLYSVNEDDGEAVTQVAVTSGILSGEVVVAFTTSDDSATDTEDYTSTTTLLTFGPDVISLDVPIPITNDNVYEPNIEQFFANLNLETTGVDVVVRPSEATIQITDDDVPSPQFEETMYTVPENDRTVELCIDIGVEITSPMTYTITTTQKSPPEAEDADITEGTSIIVPAPGPRACIDFTDLIVDDGLGLEGVEAFTILINGGAMAMVTIIDDDEVSIGFDPTTYSVREGESTDLIIRRVGDAEGPIVARVNSSDVTATADVDYDRLDGVEVVFQPGVFTQTVPVNTRSDIPSEGDEVLQAFLSTVTDGVDVTSTTALVTITEDVVPRLSFSTADVVVGEGDGVATVCLMLDVPLSTQLEVDVTSGLGSASNADFVIETVTATFAAGATDACVEFTVTDDNLALEGNETFVATFGIPPGIRPEDPSLAVVTIIDDDVFSVQFTEDDFSYLEGDPNAEVCLEGSGAIAQTATVMVSSLPLGTATAGDDYTPVNGRTVFFRPGEGTFTMCIPVQLIDDDLSEVEETFPMRIDSVTSAAPGAVVGPRPETTVIIRDNDIARIGFVEIFYEVDEADGSVIVTVGVLERVLTKDVVVRLGTRDDTATDPEDYLGVLQELTFSPTITRIDVSIPIVDDTVLEDLLEEFLSTLERVIPDTSVVIDPAQATIRISDDDMTSPQIEETMYIVPENDRTVPLCIDIGVEITSPMTFMITTTQKSPPDAEDTDFGTSASITVNPPGPRACIDFRDLVVDDNVALEGNESFTILVAGSMAMVTILDDDEPELIATSIVVPESIGDAEVCMRLVNSVEIPFTVQYRTSDSSAQSPVDYTSVDGSFDYQPGDGARCVDIPINDDALQEPTERFFVDFFLDPNRPPAASASVDIRDNDQIGEIVNDTIIGDPLFTVTLPEGNEFMCYEVHGEAGKYFNLISDTCTSVNALFTALSERLNRMSEIGIYAVNSAAECVQIQINLDGCSGSVDGGSLSLPAENGVPGQPGLYEQDGVSVRRYPTRWRVSVPNCGTTRLVMWIFCDRSRDMLDFQIARGNNLDPTSHGLLAQFWNIPINVTRIDQQNAIVEIFSPDSYRRIPAEPAPRTWDRTRATCYYVGNSQGGPSQSHDPLESVIQGRLSNYETASLFAPDFTFRRFGDTCSSNVPA